MNQIVDPAVSSWPRKFRCAARGAYYGIQAERNFKVHFVLAVAVLVAAASLRVSLLEWCLLILCIFTVLSAELFNTAIERLARAITRDHNEMLRDALDTSSGAVLMVSIGAAVVGSLVLVSRLAVVLNWWGD